MLLGWGSVELMAVLTASVAVGVALELVGLVMWPESLLATALAIDLRHGTNERFVSAVEVLSGRYRGAFDEAVIRDAGSHAKEVEPARVAPLGVHVSLWWAIPLTFAAMAWPMPSAPTPDTGTPSQTADTVGIDDLEAFREHLNEEGRGEDDPYVRAARESLRRLSEDNEGGNLSEEEAERRFQRSLEHVQRAYEEAGLPDPTQSFSGGSGAAPDAQATEAPNDLEMLPQPRLTPSTAADEATTEQAEGTSDSPSDDDSGVDTTSAEIRQGAPQEAGPTDVMYGERPPEQEAIQRAREQESSEAAGEVIGAAQRSNRGASELAGGGEQPMDGEPQGATPRTPDEDVSLPTADRGEGRRIDIELPPEVSQEGATDTPGQTGDWQRVDEATSNEAPVDAAVRNVVRQYFTPSDDANSGR
ncbi:MAG: hypothetical protein U5K81_00665 [Trueperaceae bacterium]|nr:hypothetical protein [Trueperaceae bacterium]